MNWRKRIADESDGIATARTMFLCDIVYLRCGTATKHEFTRMNVQNHRVDITMKTPRDIFPRNDSPRGHKDINSVRYHMKTRKPIDPLMILERDGELIILDGVHRLAAAYLLNSPIRYCVYGSVCES